MNDTKKNNGMTLSMFSILLMFMGVSGGTFENPALQTTMEAWPAVAPSSIMMMITIPNITSMVAMLLFGAIVGKKISYRFGNVIALICSVVGGLLPIFYCPSWGFMLVMRGILGVSVGYYGVRNALIIRSVDSSRTARFIGFGGIVNGITSTVMGPIVGFLTGYGWRAALWCNAVMALIGIANLLWLKEPEKETVEINETKTAADGSKPPMVAYVYAVLQFLHVLCIYPLLLGMSTFVSERQLGSAVIAGNLVAIFQASGLVINGILPFVQRVCGKSVVAVSFLFSSIGMAIVLFVPNIIAIAVGVFMVGIGYLLTVSILQVFNGMACNVGAMTLASTIITAFNQLGVFSSPYFMSISDSIFHRGSQVESSFMCASIALLTIAVITFVFKGKIYPDNKH